MIEYFLSSVNLIFFALIILILTTGVLIYNWRRRWLYYYASKIPGPFALPLIGSVHLARHGPPGVHKFLKSLYIDYPSVLKIWLGPDLYVSTTEPNHLKVLLTRFLDKGNFYHLMSGYFQRALAAAPVDLWKQNRKNINPTFNVTLISSFIGSFNKHAKLFTERFEDACGKETDDIYPSVWRCTLDAGCETLADVDPSAIKTQDYLAGVFRIEEILMHRFYNPFLHLDVFWYFSPLKKELEKLWKQNCSCMQKMINLMASSDRSQFHDTTTEDGSMKKRFLSHLIDLNCNQQVPHDYVLEESQIMFFVGTETSAVVLSSTLLVLGMYPDVQKKIDEELNTIFGDSDRDPTLEDVNHMEYLERVIKETMRLLPPIPFIMRSVDENIDLGSHVFPKGAKLIIPIPIVHRRPEFWTDPQKFDPERFLPEEVEKRPPCSYMPFSYGIRNCIGYRYGLLSMKVILSTFLRSYKVTSSNYKSIEDIDLFIHVVAKPQNGYKITIEKK